MASAFNTIACVMIPLVLYGLLYAVNRIRHHEPIFDNEEYERLPDGSVIAPRTVFNSRARVLELKNRQLPFDQISGVYLRGLSSRRIGIGVTLQDGDWLQISVVSDGQMNVAAQNAELITEVIAHESAQFKNACHNYDWQQVLMGNPFVYEFQRGQ